MNIQNEKMSARQVGCMVFYDFFPLTTLLLPGMLTRTVGIDGFFVLIGGEVLGFLLLKWILRQICGMEVDYQKHLMARFGRLVGVCILLVYLFAGLFAASYGIQLLCRMVRAYLIRDTKVWLVMGALMILVLYGLESGAECRGRMYELLIVFVVIPLVLFIAFAASGVEPQHWVPVGRANAAGAVHSIYLVFVFFMGSVCVPMYQEVTADREHLEKTVTQSYLVSAILNAVLFLVLTGIFGVQTVAVMEEPVLELLAMVKLPGGFLERQDALLCTLWFIAMFGFVENTLHVAVWSAQKIGQRISEQWYIVAAGMSSYVLALGLYHDRGLAFGLGWLMVRIAVPVLVIALFILGIHARRTSDRQHKKRSKSNENA